MPEFKPRSIVNKKDLSDTHTEARVSSHIYLREEARKMFPELHQDELMFNENEIKVIDLINKNINSFVKKYDPNAFPIYKEDIHKVTDKKLMELTKIPAASALYAIQLHQIYFRETKNPAVSFSATLHEMLHAQSFTLFQIHKKEMGIKNIGIYQSGIISADEKYLYLEQFNEAITEYLAKKLYPTIKDSIPGEKDKDEMVDTFNQHVSLQGFPIKNSDEVITFEVLEEYGGLAKVAPVEHRYKPQRQFLQVILEDMQKYKPDLYTNLEKAEDIFFKAYFSGNFEEMYNVIDGIYGEGTVKKIKLIDKRKFQELPDHFKGGFKLISLIESIKNENKN